MSLERVAYRVKPTVAGCRDYLPLSPAGDGNFRRDPARLLKMAFRNIKHRTGGDIGICKNLVNLLRCKLFMPLIRRSFYKNTHFILHFIRQRNTEILF